MSPAGPVAITVRWAELFHEASGRLGDGKEARWLLEDASGGTWPAVLDEPVPPRSGSYFRSLVDRRAAGEPLQYVLGHWSFRHLDLMVDRRVLVPRPETETVVEVALAEIRRLEAERPLVVDLGTGSGAIALSVATEHPSAEVWATDSSGAALAVASANLAGLGARAAGRVSLAHGDWWHALPEGLRGSVDLVVSNPPYISAAEVAELDGVVRDWEPHEALLAGPTGLEALETVVTGAPAWLGARGAVVCEIAPHQAAEAVALALRAGFPDTATLADLAGRPRVLVARR